MNLFLSIFIFLSAAPVLEAAPLHSNVVGELRIENFKNELYMEAIMDKRFLATALKKEAKCSPENMLEVCGNQYILDHIQIMVNGETLR
ncbi:MAG: hypothetical protein JXR10_13855 [Cyclobacteriaceae bacterium]